MMMKTPVQQPKVKERKENARVLIFHQNTTYAHKQCGAEKQWRGGMKQ